MQTGKDKFMIKIDFNARKNKFSFKKRVLIASFVV
jgi:hypothetical protein